MLVNPAKVYFVTFKNSFLYTQQIRKYAVLVSYSSNKWLMIYRYLG